MLFFNSQQKRIIWWVLYAFFCALIGSLGIFRFATVNNQLLKNTAFAALLIVLVMAIIISILKFHSAQVPEDKNPLANKIAIVFVLYFLLLGGGTFYLGEGLLHIANALFDQSEAESHQVAIINIFTRQSSRGQAIGKSINVPSWNDKYPGSIDLDVSHSAADYLKAGDNIIVKTKKGSLGYEWIVEVFEADNTINNNIIKDDQNIFPVGQSVTAENINQVLNTLRPLDGLEWQLYKNEEAGFSFKYPSYINTIDVKTIKNDNQFNLHLIVKATKIDDLELVAPFNYDKEAVLKFKNEIESGIAQYGPGCGKNGRKMIKVQDKNIFISMQLSCVEVCNMSFLRVLQFFHNGYFIEVDFGINVDSELKLLNAFIKTIVPDKSIKT